mgnify:CR=1 FL=1
MHNFKNQQNISYCENKYEALDSSDALVLITEWKEFRGIDIADLGKTLKNKILFDGRNIYEPSLMHSSGFTYYGIGRGESIYE